MLQKFVIEFRRETKKCNKVRSTMNRLHCGRVKNRIAYKANEKQYMVNIT